MMRRDDDDDDDDDDDVIALMKTLFFLFHHIIPSTLILRIVMYGVVMIGTGVAGFNYDLHPATSSQLAYPYDLAIDTSGNLFISGK